MTKKIVLTKEIATSMVNDDPPEWYSLVESCTEIENAEVAKIIAKCYYGAPLKNICSITPEIAQELSNIKNRDLSEGLVLDGLTSMEEDVAKQLAKLKANLSLKGLPEVSEFVFAALCEMKQGALDLSGLKMLPRITADTIKALSKKRKNHQIKLNGIVMINEEEAEMLSKYTGNFLFLEGIQSLGLQAAKKLAHWKGCVFEPNIHPQACLYLSGLKELTDDEAQALASFTGELNLPKAFLLKVRHYKAQNG